MKAPKKTLVYLSWLAALVHFLLENGLPHQFVPSLLEALDEDAAGQAVPCELGPSLSRWTIELLAACDPASQRQGVWQIELTDAKKILGRGFHCYFGGPEKAMHETGDVIPSTKNEGADWLLKDLQRGMSNWPINHLNWRK